MSAVIRHSLMAELRQREDTKCPDVPCRMGLVGCAGHVALQIPSDEQLNTFDFWPVFLRTACLGSGTSGAIFRFVGVCAQGYFGLLLGPFLPQFCLEVQRVLLTWALLQEVT